MQTLAVAAQDLHCDIVASAEQASQEFVLNIYPGVQERHVVAVSAEQVAHPVEQD